MIGFIIACLFVILVSSLLGGLPFFIWIVMVEMAGLGSYMGAITYLAFAVIELVMFIAYLLGTEYDFDVKDIFKCIKNIFKKSKKEIVKTQRKKTSGKIGVKTIELIIFIGCIILAIFYKPHSIFLNLIYDNLIVRILYISSIPLFIMNVINGIKSDFYDGIGDVLATRIPLVLVELVIGLAISSTVLMLSETQDKYNYINENIQSLFVYDNREYDEIRSSDDFKSEYDFLNNTLGKTLTSLKEKYDINKESDYQTIKNNIFKLSDIKEYGYSVTDSTWEDDYIEYICVVDKKNKNHTIYKLNYKDYSLQKSSDEEFKEIRSISN